MKSVADVLHAEIAEKQKLFARAEAASFDLLNQIEDLKKQHKTDTWQPSETQANVLIYMIRHSANLVRFKGIGKSSFSFSDDTHFPPKVAIATWSKLKEMGAIRCIKRDNYTYIYGVTDEGRSVSV